MENVIWYTLIDLRKFQIFEGQNNLIPLDYTLSAVHSDSYWW